MQPVLSTIAEIDLCANADQAIGLLDRLFEIVREVGVNSVANAQAILSALHAHTNEQVDARYRQDTENRDVVARTIGSGVKAITSTGILSPTISWKSPPANTLASKAKY